MKTLVIVPTYDEAANIGTTLDRLRASVPGADVLVVDDASPDGTGRLVDAIARRDDAVHVLHRTEKAGLGAAYLAGFAWGRDRGYDVLAEMDADGSHRPEQLPTLLGSIARGDDLVLGSRWVPGGQVVNWPWRRRMLSWSANWYARHMLAIDVRDSTAGFRAMRTTALDRLGLDEVASHGYCFQVDLTRRAVRAGLAVAEVPITFVERAWGTSKMNGSIVREALWRVTVWGLQNQLARTRRVHSSQEHMSVR